MSEPKLKVMNEVELLLEIVRRLQEKLKKQSKKR